MSAPAGPSLDEIETFLAVGRAGSFVGAARATQTPISTVSRRVAALERQLGVQLIRRSTRALALTPDGQAFYDQCASAVSEIRVSIRSLGDRSTDLRGPLRITAPQYACNADFGPMLLDFAARHPGLQLDLRLTNGSPDLIEENIDLAFQLAPLPDGRHVARRLWTIPYALCASPSFLGSADQPALVHPRDLKRAQVIITPPIDNWHFETDGGAAFVLGPPLQATRVDDLGLGHHAARAGLGYAYLPRGLIEPDLGKGLEEVVIGDWRPRARELYAVYPPSRQLSPKVRALINFALDARAAHDQALVALA